MSAGRVERRLAAILAADVAGYRAFLGPCAAPEFLELAITGLRLAGLPEE